MRVSIKKVKVRSDWKWRTQWFPRGGGRVRHFHNTKGEAEAEAADVGGRTQQTGTAWQGWPAERRADIIALVAEADAAGFTLRQAFNFYRDHRDLTALDLVSLKALVHEAGLDRIDLRKAFEFYKANQNVAESTMRVGEAYRLWLAELGLQRVTGKSLKAYKSNVGRFLKDRMDRPLVSIGRDDVIKWLDNPDWSPNTFNSYLTSLNTFFSWCEKTSKITKSPTATIRKIDKTAMPNHDQPPIILSVEQAKRLLRACLAKDPGLIPYVATGLFGGLRPESEAAKLPKCDVNGHVLVRATNAKDRQRRYVEINPTLKAWLDLGGDFATVDGEGKIQPIVNLRRRFEEVREAAGLIRVEREGRGRTLSKTIHNTGWGTDCLRHSFASHYLPIHGADKTIAQLGHGDYSMLFGHYRALVTPEEAAKFWEITPDVIKNNRLQGVIDGPGSATGHGVEAGMGTEIGSQEGS